jgi:hypothetical protein
MASSVLSEAAATSALSAALQKMRKSDRLKMHT